MARNRSLGVVLLLALALCPALTAASHKAASPAEVKQADQATPPTPSGNLAPQDAPPGPTGMKLILLEPSVRAEDILTGSFAPLLGAEQAEYDSLLLDAARRAVGSKARLPDTSRNWDPRTRAGCWLSA
jgi:hypothetical protein